MNQLDQSSEEERRFSWEICKENLAHARHVENERLTFITLFTALVGGAFAFLAGVDRGRASGCLIAEAILWIRVLLNIICMWQTSRWNQVFDQHKERAKAAFRQCAGLPRFCTDEQMNDRYWFETNKHRIHTKQLFQAFNLLLFLPMFALIIYFLLPLL